MEQKIINYFIKYNCKEKTIIDIKEIFNYLKTNEQKFNDFIEWVYLEMNKENNLLVSKGLYNLLLKNFEESCINYEKEKRAKRFIEK